MTTGGPCPDTPEGFCMVDVAAILMSVQACSSYPCHSVARTLSTPTFTLSLEPEKESKVQCQWNCCWKTTLMRARPPGESEKPAWWEWRTILIRDHPHKTERPPWWETTLMRDHPGETERPLWRDWQTISINCYSDEDHSETQRPPQPKTTLIRVHPDQYQ